MRELRNYIDAIRQLPLGEGITDAILSGTATRLLRL
jgi:hypothetical protein